MQRRWVIGLVLILTLAATACGDDSSSTTTAAGATTAPEASCAVEDLNLITPDTLTVATGDPAFPPWVSGIEGDNFDDPASKTGFEAALVYAIAEELGFTDDQVVWVRTGFDEAVAAGPKTFDFNIQQYAITAERDEVVDFSDPYYESPQGLIALADSPAIGATSFADLADVKLGAEIGSTSIDFIEQVIQPGGEAAVYDSTVDAKSAMEAGQIDGIVTDLPTAFYITSVEIPDAVIVAQFGAEAATPDEFGMLFADGNPLVACVNQALATLKANGTVADLESQWLTQGGEIATINE
jgi:polar amino acid transport system substrate-binding protein